jgi:hypothetical protein
MPDTSGTMRARVPNFLGCFFSKRQNSALATHRTSCAPSHRLKPMLTLPSTIYSLTRQRPALRSTSRAPLAKILLSITAIIISSLQSSANPLCDYDGDKRSDIAFFRGKTLTITSPGLSDRAKIEGDLATDIPFLAPSTRETYSHLLAIRSSENAQKLSWRRYLLDGSRILRSFGEPGNTFLIGGNVAGDRSGDVVEVFPDNDHLTWRIYRDIFGAKPLVENSFSFGLVGDRVFLSRFQSHTRQRLGVFGPLSQLHARALLKSVETGRILSFRSFPASLAKGQRPRPISMKDDKGRDALLFPTTNETDTILPIYSMRGRRIARVVIAEKGEVVVGEFNHQQDGEEIAIYDEASIPPILTIINPFNRQRITRLPFATPLGTVRPCLAAIRAPKTEPTLTPTPTPTSIPTATVTPTT